MDVVILIGRIVFSLLFVGAGLMGHLVNLDGTSQYAESKGVRPGKPLVAGSGLMIIAAGLMVAFGIWMDLAALLLMLFLLVAAFTVHTFWKLEDEMMAQAEMSQFMKNLSLTGAALMLLGFTALVDDLGLTVTGPLFFD